jgi:hypothetical protein
MDVRRLTGKDDVVTGRYIGIMDPTERAGVADVITNNDLSALIRPGLSAPL